jgi:TonB family protein
MNDPVDRLRSEREQIDRGFKASVVISVAAHLLLLGSTVVAAILGSKAPPLQVQDGFAVPLPRGGGGVRSAAPPAPAPTLPAKPAPEPEAPPDTLAAPPPKILKPPREEPRKGLPELDAKKGKARPTPAPAPRSGGAAGGTDASPRTPGLEFGPPGPGTPGGTELLGDWYLAGVQRKIWMLWTQQIRPAAPQPVTISFTIAADGSVGDVRIVQTSGIYLLDSAAQRAIYSAGPFGPLPRDYGTDRYTIQAIFKPTN